VGVRLRFYVPEKRSASDEEGATADRPAKAVDRVDKASGSAPIRDPQTGGRSLCMGPGFVPIGKRICPKCALDRQPMVSPLAGVGQPRPHSKANGLMAARHLAAEGACRPAPPGRCPRDGTALAGRLCPRLTAFPQRW
jgi:hypothetical protein